MIVNYYDIKGCQFCQNGNGQPVLLSPPNADPVLLQNAGFVMVQNQWVHYLSKPEFDYIMANQVYGEVSFVYQGNPYNFTYPAQKETPEEKRNGNRLAAISLGLFVIPFIVSLFTSSVTVLRYNAVRDSEAVSDPSSIGVLIAEGFCGISRIVSFIMMIITRIKYPKNTFGKVMMWLYIVLGIIVAIGIIALAVACGQCVDGMRNCPG